MPPRKRRGAAATRQETVEAIEHLDLPSGTDQRGEKAIALAVVYLADAVARAGKEITQEIRRGLP